RLYSSAELLFVELSGRAAQDPAVRPGEGLRTRGHARNLSQRAGGRAIQGLEIRRRPGRRREGEARRSDLCFGWAGWRLAHGRRAAAPGHENRRAARPTSPCALRRL